MRMNDESWWTMHEAMVSELQARDFTLEDNMRNPDVFVTGVAIDTVYEASESPTSNPVEWKNAVISRWRNNNAVAEARKRELFLGAQIGAAFAKQYFEEHPGVITEATV